MAPNESSSNSFPKRTAPRMRATRLTQAETSRRGRQTRSAGLKSEHRSDVSPADDSASFTIKSASGSIPLYNDHPFLIQDPFNKKVYSVGGFRCSDSGSNPTPDFYSCETSNMKWTNLTNRLMLRNPYNPFSKLERTRSTKTLPRISFPGATLLRIEKTSYIALFGGFDSESKRARSEILIIDPDKREWWTVPIQGGEVEPRINPAIVAIDNSIFIFSGYRRFGTDPQPHHSYNIAECNPDSGVWQWSARDVPYSALVPAGQAFQEALSIYNGTKILLTPGRTTENKQRINFTSENCFFFHTKNKRFQSATADITGVLPTSLRWYHIYRPSKAPSSFDSSIIVCGFIDVSGTENIAPELWHLFLSPEERVECLAVNKKIWDLDSHFKCSLYLDGQVRLLGTGAEDAEDANAMFDIYADIPCKK